MLSIVPPPYRNWKAPAMRLTLEMRLARDKALRDQPELIAMASSVQYAKVLAK